MLVKFKIRRGTTAEWETANPVLADGEPGWDETTRTLKFGDGVSTWIDLPAYGGIGPQGPEGPEGPEGAAGIGSDEELASYIADTESLTRAEIDILIAAGGGGGGGTTDHGALDGLLDDDHPQYALADGTRGAFATSAQGATADSAVQPGDLHAVATSGAYADLSGKPTIPDSHDDIGAAPASHSHSIADVTGLQAELDGKVETLTYANAAPGMIFDLLWNGVDGWVDPATDAVASARPSTRDDIRFWLSGGPASEPDPWVLLNGDSRWDTI